MISYVIVCRILCREGLFVSLVCDYLLVLSIPSSFYSLRAIVVYT